MPISLFLRAWIFRLLLGVALAISLRASAEARTPDEPLFWNVPIALSPQCSFLVSCGGFDSIGLHIANTAVVRGNRDRNFAAVQDLVRLSLTLLDVAEVGGALGGHFVHDEAGDEHAATAPARLFARLRLYPLPWVSLKGGLSVATSYDRSFVSERLGAAEPPGMDLNTARLTFHRSFRFVEIDGGAGMLWGSVPDGRWVSLELSASVALNLFTDPGDANERLRVLVQGLYRQPLARPDGAQGIREVYALAGVELKSGSGYGFSLGIGPQVLNAQAGALVQFDVRVSWGLRYRNPIAESLAGRRRIPAAWMDLFYTDPVLRADGCIWSDPLPQANPFLIKCIGRPDPKDPGKIILFSGGYVDVGTHLWVRDDGTLVDQDQFEYGEIDREMVPYVRAIQALAAKLAKEKHAQEASTGQRCGYQADILRGVSDPGLMAVLAHDDMGGAAALLGSELMRALKCGDPTSLGGSGILPLLGRGPFKKGPVAYRGTLIGHGEAEHIEPAVVPEQTPLTDKGRAHIFYGDLDKRAESKGWHYEPSGDPKKGTYVIEKTRSAADKHGVYEANVMIEGVQKKARSTFFPKDWTEQQVESAILEAYENRQVDAVRPWVYVGTASNGMKIQMEIQGGKIGTAYPLYLREGP